MDGPLQPKLAAGPEVALHEDFLSWIDRNRSRAYELHARHMNPSFVRMLRTIGFDKTYVRGEGCWLWDEQGNKYLDLLTGWGVFALGRNHPKVKAILQQVLNQEFPNLVRMECGPLAGLAAELLIEKAGATLERVFFCNSGTESVEGAIKFARCATG